MGNSYAGVDGDRISDLEPNQVSVIDSPDTRWQLFEQGLYEAASRHDIALMMSPYLADGVDVICFIVSAQGGPHCAIAHLANGSRISVVRNTGYPTFRWTNQVVYTNSETSLMQPIDDILEWLREGIDERPRRNRSNDD